MRILEYRCSAGNKIDGKNGGYYTRMHIDIHDIMPTLRVDVVNYDFVVSGAVSIQLN